MAIYCKTTWQILEKTISVKSHHKIIFCTMANSFFNLMMENLFVSHLLCTSLKFIEQTMVNLFLIPWKIIWGYLGNFILTYHDKPFVFFRWHTTHFFMLHNMANLFFVLRWNFLKYMNLENGQSFFQYMCDFLSRTGKPFSCRF